MTEVVINNCYGGFDVAPWIRTALHLAEDELPSRTNSTFVRLVREDPFHAGGRYTELAIALVPDGATDWRIMDYDGMEWVIYVQNGHIFDADILSVEDLIGED